MKKHITFPMLIVCLFLVSQCTKSEQQLIEEFGNRSLVESAEFYRDARTDYDSADRAFSKTIVPQLQQCRFKDLQKVRNCVVNTPVYNEVDMLYNNRHSAIASSAESMLSNLAYAQQRYLVDSIIPAIAAEVRNTNPMHQTLADVIDDYKGWFGKIFDSVDDFQEEWDEKITHNECQSWINSIASLQKFKNKVNQEYFKYCDQNCSEETHSLYAPDSIAVDLTMPKDIVAAWVDGEQDKTKDKALNMLGSFAETFITNKMTKQKTSAEDVANNIFDNSVNDYDTRMKNKSDDEKLIFLLSEALLSKIIYGIYTSYMDFFNKQNDLLLSQMIEGYKPRSASTQNSSSSQTTTSTHNNNKPQKTQNNATAPSTPSTHQSSNTQQSSTQKSSTVNNNQQSNATSIKGKYPFTSQRLVTERELNSYSSTELKIMRNEIFARYGYIFKKGGEMETYFKQQSWYKPKYSDVKNLLSDIENQNIATIKKVEATKK